MNTQTYISDSSGIYLSSKQINLFQKQLEWDTHQTQTLAILKELTDPTKHKIILLLSQTHELPVADISTVLTLSSSATSHALRDLRNLGVVDCRRCGQLACYRLSDKFKQSTLSSVFSSLLPQTDKQAQN